MDQPGPCHFSLLFLFTFIFTQHCVVLAEAEFIAPLALSHCGMISVERCLRTEYRSKGRKNQTKPLNQHETSRLYVESPVLYLCNNLSTYLYLYPQTIKKNVASRLQLVQPDRTCIHLPRRIAPTHLSALQQLGD